MAEQRVVIVTGAAKGIGRFVAGTFARHGDAVVVADIAPLDVVSADLAPYGVPVLPVTTDVGNAASVQAMVEKVMERFGRIDVLVNNAGIVPHFSWGVPQWPRVAEMEPSFWDRVIGTNLGGTFLCTKHVLPHMEAQGGGHVLTVYGGGTLGTTAGAYVVTKEAIRIFTRFVAEEERPHNVCVICVYPGSVIATWEAPSEARARLPGPEIVGDRFVLASRAGMEMSGCLVDMVDGRLTVRQPREYGLPSQTT